MEDALFTINGEAVSTAQIQGEQQAMALEQQIVQQEMMAQQSQGRGAAPEGEATEEGGKSKVASQEDMMKMARQDAEEYDDDNLEFAGDDDVEDDADLEE